MSIETIWLAIGFLGQGVFFTRWVVQWVASERSAASRVPTAFWYMSLIGGLITLAYAIYRRDPVFIAGQSVGAFVYLLRSEFRFVRRSATTTSVVSLARVGRCSVLPRPGGDRAHGSR